MKRRSHPPDKYICDEMLDHAAHIFAEQGFYDTPTQDLAIKGRFSQARYFDYFDTKNGLLRQMHGKFWDGINKEIPANLSDRNPVEQIRTSLQMLCRYAARNRDLAIVILRTTYPIHNDETDESDEIDSFRRRVRRKGLTLIKQAENQICDKKIPIEVIYESISGSVQQLLDKFLLSNKKKRGPHVVDQHAIDRCIDAVLKGFFLDTNESVNPKEIREEEQAKTTEKNIVALLQGLSLKPEEQKKVLKQIAEAIPNHRE